MKDFWKRMVLLYPNAVKAALDYGNEICKDVVIPIHLETPVCVEIGVVLQFISENELVDATELSSELFASSGDFVDNAQQLIEEFLELLEEKL